MSHLECLSYIVKRLVTKTHKMYYQLHKGGCMPPLNLTLFFSVFQSHWQNKLLILNRNKKEGRGLKQKQMSSLYVTVIKNLYRNCKRTVLYHGVVIYIPVIAENKNGSVIILNFIRLNNFISNTYMFGTKLNQVTVHYNP